MTVKLCSGADVKMVQSNAGKVFHKQALQENIREGNFYVSKHRILVSQSRAIAIGKSEPFGKIMFYVICHG